MEKWFSVKEVAALLGYKNEETIKKTKRWAFSKCIPKQPQRRLEDTSKRCSNSSWLFSKKKKNPKQKSSSTDYNKFELVKLAYQIATLTSPEGVHKALTSLPLEQALKICLILRQQSRPIDAPFKFVKAAITKKWTPDPITDEKKKV
ncbi:hypothetical protein [Bacillus thuringiensis]|uniref:hypothetical protein n=1 Tax=Bacillus thuringiensis TaxID=1428 RepID=UPI001E60C51F|nr:hypothetical protein [Bacillus thuringiensis]